jgi:uncharacterized membrane protein YeaQ/YmgE (transglycosylase-associated protein family)
LANAAQATRHWLDPPALLLRHYGSGNISKQRRAWARRRGNRGGIVMSGQALLIILLIGLIAGWLAGQIVQGTGFGIIADICIGIIGALIGSWLLPQLGVHIGTGIVAEIVSATIGAILLLIILRLVRGRGRW